tara:strand:+ start:196 stop:714 length:519 start_codon:yes stop_codon:yes gene_type:complete
MPNPGTNGKHSTHLGVKEHAVAAREKKLRKRHVGEEVFKLDAIDLPAPLQARVLWDVLWEHNVERAVECDARAPWRKHHWYPVNVHESSQQVDLEHGPGHIAARTRLLSVQAGFGIQSSLKRKKSINWAKLMSSQQFCFLIALNADPCCARASNVKVNIRVRHSVKIENRKY